jgi:LacI family transcriptional regulator
MQAITDLGLSCPGDISLAGIDDFAWAGTFAPRLTTSRQPIDALAEHAVRILHGRMLGRTAKIEQVVLSARLIVRDSCAPLGDRLNTRLDNDSARRIKRLANNRPV